MVAGDACASTYYRPRPSRVKTEASDGCTVITDFQTAGQTSGNQWEAAPPKP
jgi:BirA family biotin operon repressor/biotin-[acetyl-CoA-carboxylase] ligase